MCDVRDLSQVSNVLGELHLPPSGWKKRYVTCLHQKTCWIWELKRFGCEPKTWIPDKLELGNAPGLLHASNRNLVHCCPIWCHFARLAIAVAAPLPVAAVEPCAAPRT